MCYPGPAIDMPPSRRLERSRRLGTSPGHLVHPAEGKDLRLQTHQAGPLRHRMTPMAPSNQKCDFENLPTPYKLRRESRAILRLPFGAYFQAFV